LAKIIFFRPQAAEWILRWCEDGKNVIEPKERNKFVIKIFPKKNPLNFTKRGLKPPTHLGWVKKQISPPLLKGGD
jgi:hypothetical protein